METKTSVQLENLEIPGFHKVVKVTDPVSGLKAIIAIHDLTLGPALGGTRIMPYASWDEALFDVLRLAKGMTYKSAVSNAGTGGSKSVIIADPKTITDEQLQAFGEAVNQLQGEHICAADMGCTPAYLAHVRKSTQYVVGLAHKNSSGNPGPFTAYGVYRGIQAGLKQAFGSESVQGRTVAIQGLGSVGSELARYLFWGGARLILNDFDEEKARELAHQFGGTVCPSDEIMSVKCDVFAPCAMGGIINSQTVKELNCRIVAGGANNQLQNDNHAIELMQKGIVYAPDFLINSGGLINVACEIEPEGYDPVLSRDKTDSIYEQLLTTFQISQENRCSTHQAAVELASYRLRYGIGKRTTPPVFHH
ncbi:MAG: Glu/Leu/Phe/Val dehydrogenase [Chlamydiales bacterium]|nr:Glu/Leu/Phe/Val dehydrogenase [Chlamydiales bacterium]